MSANLHADASASALIWHVGSDQHSLLIDWSSRLVLKNFSCPAFQSCHLARHRRTASRRARSYGATTSAPGSLSHVVCIIGTAFSR
eukprot:3508718-Pyramimonas_sp.AAC.1